MASSPAPSSGVSHSANSPSTATRNVPSSASGLKRSSRLRGVSSGLNRHGTAGESEEILRLGEGENRDRHRGPGIDEQTRGGD